MGEHANLPVRVEVRQLLLHPKRPMLSPFHSKMAGPIERQRKNVRGEEKMAVQDTVAFAADHAGVELKAHLRAMAERHGFSVLDLGTHTPDSADYPDYAQAAGQAVVDGHPG